MQQERIKIGTIVIYKCYDKDAIRISKLVRAQHGQKAIVVTAYTSGKIYTDPIGSYHTLPESCPYVYDIYFLDRQLQWTVAKEEELTLSKE